MNTMLRLTCSRFPGRLVLGSRGRAGGREVFRSRWAAVVQGAVAAHWVVEGPMYWKIADASSARVVQIRRSSSSICIEPKNDSDHRVIKTPKPLCP